MPQSDAAQLGGVVVFESANARIGAFLTRPALP